eukprot:TRINITY_DN5414_c0_g1_i3.p1 TRINITY_DN5414_c0_g1~~TRINITY_DN5414_c0_g1_i3.p1  ORF type:complete len:544 (-),score=145.23 TRINITY_DN5414_c0_g1_i3:74-1705(-)
MRRIKDWIKATRRASTTAAPLPADEMKVDEPPPPPAAAASPLSADKKSPSTSKSRKSKSSFSSARSEAAASSVTSVGSGGGDANCPPKEMLGYYLGPTLGQGHFGRVKIGVHKRTYERVALKVMVKAAPDYAVEDVKREADALMSLNHENIIKCLGMEIDAEYPLKGSSTESVSCIILELAEGGPLFDFLKYCGGLQEVIARTYFRQLIAGVEECHRHGIVHRDIKLENLLLSKDYVLKIGDFGLCQTGITDETVMMNQRCGTPQYKAPEIHEKREYNWKCDVFSCGVILFILLAGYPPFRKAAVSDQFYQPLVNADSQGFWKIHYRITDSITEDFKTLVEGMLSYDIDDRYSIADVKNSSWYKGDVLSQEELAEELRRKKDVVDAKKAEATPSEKKGILSRLDSEPQRHYIQGSFSSLADEPTSPNDEMETVPDLWDDDLGYEVFTQLRFKRSATKLRSMIRNLLITMKVRHAFDETEWAFTATIPIPETVDQDTIEELIVSFKIYAVENSKVHIVVVQRLAGNVFNFNEFFEELQSYVNPY